MTKINVLTKNIEFEIYESFEKKIQKADLPSDIEQNIYERIEACLDKVIDEIEATNYYIDSAIEDVETQRNMLPPNPDGWAIRQNELYEASKYM